MIFKLGSKHLLHIDNPFVKIDKKWIMVRRPFRVTKANPIDAAVDLISKQAREAKRPVFFGTDALDEHHKDPVQRIREQAQTHSKRKSVE